MVSPKHCLLLAMLASIGGLSGSNREMETDASIEIDWSLQDLFEHIAEQVNAQDWMLDSESIGPSVPPTLGY